MTSTAAARSDEYRRYAQDCWKFASDAMDIETKAVFQLTAEAWTMLASQIETLDTADESEADITPVPVQSAA
jgi:hypothetical protein